MILIASEEVWGRYIQDNDTACVKWYVLIGRDMIFENVENDEYG